MNDKSLRKQDEQTDPLLEINSNKDQGAYAHLFYYLQLKNLMLIFITNGFT